MRTLNKKLKKLGYESDKYAIQIEHWKEVKKIREELEKLLKECKLEEDGLERDSRRNDTIAGYKKGEIGRASCRERV